MIVIHCWSVVCVIDPFPCSKPGGPETAACLMDVEKNKTDPDVVAFISSGAVIKHISKAEGVCGRIVAMMIGLGHKCCYKHI